MPPRLPIDPHTLSTICRRNGIKKLSLFGSELKGKSLFDMVQIEIDLSQGMRGRKVDVRTARGPQPLLPR